MKKTSFLGVLILLALGLAACAVPAGLPPAQLGHDEHGEGSVEEEAPLVIVNASEFVFSPANLDLSVEEFTILINNEGTVAHDFAIEGFEEQGIPYVGLQEGALNTFNLKPGTYTFYCTVEGHREAGMEGTLVIR